MATVCHHCEVAHAEVRGEATVHASEVQYLAAVPASNAIAAIPLIHVIPRERLCNSAASDTVQQLLSQADGRAGHAPGKVPFRAQQQGA